MGCDIKVQAEARSRRIEMLAEKDKVELVLRGFDNTHNSRDECFQGKGIT